MIRLSNKSNLFKYRVYLGLIVSEGRVYDHHGGKLGNEYAGMVLEQKLRTHILSYNHEAEKETRRMLLIF